MNNINFKKLTDAQIADVAKSNGITSKDRDAIEYGIALLLMQGIEPVIPDIDNIRREQYGDAINLDEGKLLVKTKSGKTKAVAPFTVSLY